MQGPTENRQGEWVPWINIIIIIIIIVVVVVVVVVVIIIIIIIMSSRFFGVSVAGHPTKRLRRRLSEDRLNKKFVVAENFVCIKGRALLTF